MHLACIIAYTHHFCRIRLIGLVHFLLSLSLSSASSSSSFATCSTSCTQFVRKSKHNGTASNAYEHCLLCVLSPIVLMRSIFVNNCIGMDLEMFICINSERLAKLLLLLCPFVVDACFHTADVAAVLYIPVVVVVVLRLLLCARARPV